MPQLALLLTTIVWGATFPATKAALEQISPLSFLFLRFLLGMIVVLAVLLLGRRRLAKDAFTLRISLIATGWLFLGYVLQTVGLRFTTASNSAFITVLYVVFVPLYLRRLGHAYLGFQWHCAGRTLVSCATDSFRQSGRSADIRECRRLCRPYGLSRALYARGGFGISVRVAIAIYEPCHVGDDVVGNPTASMFEPTRVLIVGLMVTGMLATGAFAVQMWAQRLLPAQQVALLFAAEPAVAAWLAWYFLGETLDAQGWFGSAMILGGVLLGSWATGEVSPAHPEAAPAHSQGG